MLWLPFNSLYNHSNISNIKPTIPAIPAGCLFSNTKFNKMSGNCEIWKCTLRKLHTIIQINKKIFRWNWLTNFDSFLLNNDAPSAPIAAPIRALKSIAIMVTRLSIITPPVIYHLKTLQLLQLLYYFITRFLRLQTPPFDSKKKEISP